MNWSFDIPPTPADDFADVITAAMTSLAGELDKQAKAQLHSALLAAAVVVRRFGVDRRFATDNECWLKGSLAGVAPPAGDAGVTISVYETAERPFVPKEHPNPQIEAKAKAAASAAA